MLPDGSEAFRLCCTVSSCQQPLPQVTLAVNKCENAAVADQQAADFWALGLEPIAVSAISGSGTGDLLDHLAANLPTLREDALEVELDRTQVAVAIVGRPNVGKSSLVNAIAGQRCATETATAVLSLRTLALYPGRRRQSARPLAMSVNPSRLPAGWAQECPSAVTWFDSCRGGAVDREQHERHDAGRHRH